MRPFARQLALAALLALLAPLALAEEDGAQPGREPAAHETARPTLAAPEPESPARERLVSAARRMLGRRFHGDCSGFVLSLLRRIGVRPSLPPARSRSESLWRASRKVEAPRPGDLAFFHDTYDRNRDGLANDPYTHVALVEEVEGEVVTLLHRGLRGIERVRMDLAHPSDPDANDPVRVARAGDPPGTRVLAGELFAGFGALAP